MDEHKHIDQLTVEQLRALIRETVQEAMSEVLVEFSIAAEYDAELFYRAEITELLRMSLLERLGINHTEHPGLVLHDD